MNLYLISQTEDNDYDTYDSAVVAAPSGKFARSIHPDSKHRWSEKTHNFGMPAYLNAWASSPKMVSVKKLGIAANPEFIGVICASFNAG